MRLNQLIVLLVFSALSPLLAADLSGRWAVTATDPEGQAYKSEMILQHQGDNWTGTVKAREREIPMEQIKVDGTTLTFKLPWGEYKLTITLKLDEEGLKGTFVTESGDTGPLSAKKLAEAGRLFRPQPR